MIGVAVVGLGYIGRIHAAAFRQASDLCRLVAVADRNKERTEQGAFGGDGVARYADAQQLLADPSVQAVAVCTHTDSHVALASAALRAGKHVLVEKPIALQAAAVRELARVAAASGRVCMPALCMRYWPGWAWLHEQIRSETFGRVLSATFTRLSPEPGWGRGFYGDLEQSGGALIDLHIHDADFVIACFGMPSAVHTSGSLRHMTTSYRFADGPPHVSAEGSWELAPSAGFRMGFVVICEHATLEYDSRTQPALWLHHASRGAMRAEAVPSEGAAREAVPIPAGTGYEPQARAFLASVSDPEVPLRVTLADAAEVMELLDAEQRSLASGMPIEL